MKEKFIKELTNKIKFIFNIESLTIELYNTGVFTNVTIKYNKDFNYYGLSLSYNEHYFTYSYQSLINDICKRIFSQLNKMEVKENENIN